MITTKIAEIIDQVKNLFLGFAFLNKDKCVNALIDSKSNLHFALISISSPAWMYYSIKEAKPQYLFTIHYYLLLSKNPECEVY